MCLCVSLYCWSKFLFLGGRYHPGHPANYDQPHSWSQDKEYFPFSEEGCPIVDEHWPGLQNVSANGYTRSLCILDVPEDDTFDHRLANATIDSLRLAKQQQRPFAIFAGHRRPHLPWRLPKKWWDLYADREVAPPTQPNVYDDAPNIAFTVRLALCIPMLATTSLPHDLAIGCN